MINIIDLLFLRGILQQFLVLHYSSLRSVASSHIWAARNKGCWHHLLVPFNFSPVLRPNSGCLNPLVGPSGPPKRMSQAYLHLLSYIDLTALRGCRKGAGEANPTHFVYSFQWGHCKLALLTCMAVQGPLGNRAHLRAVKVL